MNQLVAANSYDPPLETSEAASDSADELAAQRVANLFGSLRKRWWYYLTITVLAAAVAYYVAQEYGRYKYVGESKVRVNLLPYPPGDQQLASPQITNFSLYLSHPEVLTTLRDEFGVVLPGANDPPLVNDTFDRKTGMLTITAERETPEEAADLVNNLVATAIAKSTEERVEYLQKSLVYYNGLIAEAEAEAASKRQAKVDRLSAMRAKFALDPDAEIEFEEISQVISAQRDRLVQLDLELRDADRLETFLRGDEQLIVNQIKDDLIKDYQLRLESTAAQFTSTSRQAKNLAGRMEELDKLASTELSTADELDDLLREMERILDEQMIVPEDDAAELASVEGDLRQLQNRRRILPQAIEDAKKALALSMEQRAGMEISKLMDFENSPELIELTAQIDRADSKVDQLTASIDWVKGMLVLDQPAFETLTKANVETAIRDGNHLKIAVATFGLIGLLLGMPVLIRDTLHSDFTPYERLGQEFGLPTMSAQEMPRRAFKTTGIQSHDPELRLLANRIQQSAQQARGSVVLFSSLSDDISTDELTRTIAGCLAAREERVLVIDVESIDERREMVGKASDGIAVNQPQVEQGGQAPSGNATFNEAGLAVANQKLGLAAALAGGTKAVDDVLILTDETGVDRVELGPGELPVEAFASPLMSRLLDRYRNQYSLVLLSGPRAKNLADLQVLSLKCDGTLFVAPMRGNMPPTARRTVIDLMRNHVPLMGIVEIPN